MTQANCLAPGLVGIGHSQSTGEGRDRSAGAGRWVRSPALRTQWTAVHEAQKLPRTSRLADRLDSLFS